MGTWNFDIDAIPKGRNEDRSYTKADGTRVEKSEFVPEKVWLAHPTDKKVYLSYWVPPTKQTPTGWWSGWTAKEQPKAWMAFERPVHPDLEPQT